MLVNLAASTAVPLGKAFTRGHETQVNFAGGAIDACSVLCLCFLVANLSFLLLSILFGWCRTGSKGAKGG